MDFLVDVLATRISYAQAKLAMGLASTVEEQEQAFFQDSDALRAAESWGYWCHDTEMHEPPRLFRDEAPLLEAWESGYRFAENVAETRNCRDCKNSMENPCSMHG